MTTNLIIPEEDWLEASVYAMQHKPTVAEIRRLNRESWLLWPLSVLIAISEAGIDLEKAKDSRLVWFPVITPELVDAKLCLVSEATP